MSIFELTHRPNPSLFYQRHDPNDVRLGETVRHEPDDYQQADIVLLGLPQDDGVKRNKSRLGAKDAPDAIRKCLYRYNALRDLTFFDLGNTIIQSELEDTHDIHHDIVKQVLEDGKRLIVLGGGNDTSFADCSALADITGDVLAFNIDAHFDVRADVQRNSGTPYRQLLEGEYIKGDNFYEIAYQPFVNSHVYLQYLIDQGVHLFDINQVNQDGVESILDNILEESKCESIFWGLDMDVVHASDAPGVGAVNPAGLSATQFCQVAQLAGRDNRSQLFEITEVNPTYDINERTCRLAAAAVWYFADGIKEHN